MRRILFRGKGIESRKWHEGSLIDLDGDLSGAAFIVPMSSGASSIPIRKIIEFSAAVIDPRTVGQFTGMTDKYGGRIFEGDIIRTDNGSVTAISVVKYGEYYPKMFYAMLDALKPHFQHVPTTGFYAESTDEHEAMMIFKAPVARSSAMYTITRNYWRVKAMKRLMFKHCRPLLEPSKKAGT